VPGSEELNEQQKFAIY